MLPFHRAHYASGAEETERQFAEKSDQHRALLTGPSTPCKLSQRSIDAKQALELSQRALEVKQTLEGRLETLEKRTAVARDELNATLLSELNATLIGTGL